MDWVSLCRVQNAQLEACKIGPFLATVMSAALVICWLKYSKEDIRTKPARICLIQFSLL